MAGPWEIAGDAVGDVVGGVAGGIARGVDAVAGLFDVGEPQGNDHGSSNWLAWEHEEICSMLDTTVDPGDVHEGARVWDEQRQWAVDIVTRLTNELRETVSNGWRGGSADAAIASVEPVDRWLASQSDAAEHTGRLLDDAGSAAGQAKATVPPAVQHNWRQSLSSFAVGGVPGAFVDAVAQDQAQEEARMEAVQIMTRVYSAPIKNSRAAVPTYPQLIDPTLQPPEPSLFGGPAPGAGLPRDGAGVPGGGVPSGGAPYQPPVAAGLQSVGAGAVDGGQFGAAQPAGTFPAGGGQGSGGSGYPGHGGGNQGLGAAAAAMPFMPPMAGQDEQERARRGFRSAGSPGGRAGGVGGYPGGGRGGAGGHLSGGGDFGPRGSNPGQAAAGEGRVGTGGAAGGRGGSGAPGGVPVGGAGGRGEGGEDTEHRRPSYLIEMNDIFNDGRKVAPPVIGVDPPEYHD